MVLTLSPSAYNDFVADEVINFDVHISSIAMCDAFVLIDTPLMSGYGTI